MGKGLCPKSIEIVVRRSYLIRYKNGTSMMGTDSKSHFHPRFGARRGDSFLAMELEGGVFEASVFAFRSSIRVSPLQSILLLHESVSTVPIAISQVHRANASYSKYRSATI
jgi:hypothetical protein